MANVTFRARDLFASRSYGANLDLGGSRGVQGASGQLAGSADRYEGPHSNELRGNPLSPNIREAFPGLSLDRSSPDYVDQVKRVIASDIMAASGRVATDADYNYWIPKFLGPCDSCLVTSGQMSAEDYWHKRLLGMGASGADAAKFGPYAGGDGPAAGTASLSPSSFLSALGLSEGDLQTILSYLQSLAPGFRGSAAGGGGGAVAPFNPRAPKINDAFPQLSLDPKSPDYVDQLKKVIAGDIWTAGHRIATDADYAYWLPKFQGPNDSSMVTSGQMSANEYWHQRLLGMGAGGADVAQFGPYSAAGV